MTVTAAPSVSRTGRREALWRRWQKLKAERSSMDTRWQDIDRHLLPRSSRFFAQDRNRLAEWSAIMDNSATMALDRLVGGMMSYGTSPARPWMAYRVGDEELNLYKPVQEWLALASKRTLEIFDKSNTYQALPQMYEQLGAYGTAASILLWDPAETIRHYTVPIGEFVLATDYKGEVTTFFREFEKTAGQIIAEFGEQNCSPAVRSAAKRDPDTGFTIYHCIEPREDRDETKLDSVNMPWRSVYFEQGGDPDTVLRESGFDHFPVIAPRWKMRPGDTYGESPAMRALGDIRQLQHEQRHKADVLNQMTDPSLQVPTSMTGRQIDRLPGGVNYYDQLSPQSGIRRAYEVALDWQGLQADLLDVRQRIGDAFYSNLFVMLSSLSDTTQRTAAEIAVREEEKMAMLGPVSRQLNRELRAPLVNITFKHLLASGQLPPPPPELHGMELSIEYLDVFSQAQKQIGVNSNDRLISAMLNVAAARPEIMDKLDVDAAADDYADRYGTNPKLIYPTDDPRVQQLRKSRAAAQSAQAQAALAATQAKTAKDLAGASTAPGNALSDLQQFTGGPAANQAGV